MTKKALIILAVLSIVYGCSKDNDNEQTIVDENLIASFSQSNVDADIRDFFSSELPLLRKYEDFDTPFNWKGWVIEEKCTLINSMDEFHTFYRGEKTLPQIDFENQTLIIGWHAFGMISDIDKLELRKDANGYTLNIYTVRYKGLNKVMAYWVCYWGIFPKQTEKPVNVNLILNFE